LLVPPRDPASLAEAILRLASDDGLRQSIGDAGRAMISEQFDVHCEVRALADMYAQICADVLVRRPR
jgi:glycosyltransferase involved in cell wall biosynthesis